MSLNTQELFDQIARKHSATSQSTVFTSDFFMALKRVGLDLASSKVGISMTMPTDAETDIECDDNYLNVIICGVNKYLRETGSWGQGDNQELDARYEQELRRAHTYYCSTQTIYTRGGGHSATDDDES